MSVTSSPRPVPPAWLAVAIAALSLVAGTASADVDLNGTWASRLHEDYIDRGPGTDLGDYTGLALTDEARALALAYHPSTYAMEERQCIPSPLHVASFLPSGLRIWSELDAAGRIVAWRLSAMPERVGATIWMDGRPHPSPNAFSAFEGFTTGRWEGDTLTTVTTNLKAGYTRRGTGIPASDQATVVTHYTRHDDLLTIVTIQEDPIYLAERLVVSRTYQLNPRGNQAPWLPCFSANEVPRFQDSGIVPHFLEGENTAVDFLTKTYNLPREAVLGYAHTLYPEYRRQVGVSYTEPAVCTRYCCGWIEAQGRPPAAPNLSCLTDGTGRLSMPPPVEPQASTAPKSRK